MGAKETGSMFHALLFVLATQAQAGGSSVHQYALDTLSCNTARSLVANEGAVVFHYQQDLFQLVVNGRAGCSTGDAPSRFEYDLHDARGCMLGYVCAAKDSNL
jgi:hypothetical protein